MQEKHPKIYSQKINTLKSKVQNEYYYHARKDIDNNEDDISRETGLQTIIALAIYRPGNKPLHL